MFPRKQVGHKFLYFGVSLAFTYGGTIHRLLFRKYLSPETHFLGSSCFYVSSSLTLSAFSAVAEEAAAIFVPDD